MIYIGKIRIAIKELEVKVYPRLCVFRCDASPVIGTGHVMRCLTLADELAARRWECIFWTEGQSVISAPALARSGYRIVPEWNDETALLVVDHYGLDAAFETLCRARAKKILVIDDLADRIHDCDILVDQTFGRMVKDYRVLVPAHCEILTGADYALLRSQFAAARADSLRERAEGRLARIIVSMGATNIHNITSRVLKGLAGFDGGRLAIDIVMGKNAPYMDEVREETDCINNHTRHEAVLHTDVADMAVLMANADLAVGAGGTTSWERCCLGLPSLVIEIADNQKVIAANLHAAGAAVNLGWHEKVTPDDIAAFVLGLYAAPEKLVEMSVNAAKICDGQGVKRLAKTVENVCS